MSWGLSHYNKSLQRDFSFLKILLDYYDDLAQIYTNGNKIFQ